MDPDEDRIGNNEREERMKKKRKKYNSVSLDSWAGSKEQTKVSKLLKAIQDFILMSVVIEEAEIQRLQHPEHKETPDCDPRHNQPPNLPFQHL